MVSKLTRFEAEILYAAHRQEIEALAAQWNNNAKKGDADNISWIGRDNPPWHKEYQRMWHKLETKLGGENPTVVLDWLHIELKS